MLRQCSWCCSYCMWIHVVSCLILCSRMSVLFSIMITLLGEERAGLCASQAFICLFCMFYFLSRIFSSFWCHELAAVCDCVTPLTFLLTLIAQMTTTNVNHVVWSDLRMMTNKHQLKSYGIKTEILKNTAVERVDVKQHTCIEVGKFLHNK